MRQSKYMNSTDIFPRDHPRMHTSPGVVCCHWWGRLSFGTSYYTWRSVGQQLRANLNFTNYLGFILQGLPQTDLICEMKPSQQEGPETSALTGTDFQTKVRDLWKHTKGKRRAPSTYAVPQRMKDRVARFPIEA